MSAIFFEQLNAIEWFLPKHCFYMTLTNIAFTLEVILLVMKMVIS